jgi:hypothetical protein
VELFAIPLDISKPFTTNDVVLIFIELIFDVITLLHAVILEDATI